MQIELKDLSPIKKSLRVEVGPDEVQDETAKVVKGYRDKARIPGFRQGKAPLSLIRSRFAKEIKEDVRDRLLSRCFHEATHEKGLRPLGDPAVEDLSEEEGQPLTFSTSFEVLPEIEVKDYQGVEVRKPSARVPDEDVDKALEELRQSRARLVTEEGRAAAPGDVVVAEFDGTPEEGESFRQDRMSIEIGGAGNIAAFDEALTGVKVGDEPEFDVVYPEEFQQKELAGKTVKFKVKVHEVKRRELPDLDDEFAKDLGEFDSLDELRDRIRRDLGERKEHESVQAARQAVLDKILLANPVLLPEILVEGETRHRLEDIVRGMVTQGMDPQKMDLKWDELRKRQEEPARKAVHARLILDAVAQAESLTVDKREVDQRIQAEAQRIGEEVVDLKKRLQEGGGLEAVRTQLLREKTLDYLTSVANIRNEE